MMHKKNKGVTLVEVLIALAVFLVLMTPLVSSLILSIKSTDSAKEIQNRYDYAEVLMENVKKAPIDDLRVEAKAKNYFDGSDDDFKVTPKADKKGFTIKDVTYFGTKHEKYSYFIDVVI